MIQEFGSTLEGLINCGLYFDHFFWERGVLLNAKFRVNSLLLLAHCVRIFSYASLIYPFFILRCSSWHQNYRDPTDIRSIKMKKTNLTLLFCYGVPGFVLRATKRNNQPSLPTKNWNLQWKTKLQLTNVSSRYLASLPWKVETNLKEPSGIGFFDFESFLDELSTVYFIWNVLSST